MKRRSFLNSYSVSAALLVAPVAGILIVRAAIGVAFFTAFLVAAFVLALPLVEIALLLVVGHAKCSFP
jgi:hypothetical protein